MAVSNEVLKELQDALGAENVCDDPGVLESYSYMNSMGTPMVGIWHMKPACVVLPGSGEDVQAVLGICREHHLKFKPLSNGWIYTALSSSRNCVLMDLRRMNRIIELNEKDGYVVIEPYVTSGEMQTEVMKKGLFSHVVGAGPNSSNLASATSVQGSGGTGSLTSNNERNLLGVELVTAGGDVLHLGSVGTPNAGWFCGDGPGPSLRGMMRGAIGNMGSQGVYTRAALKCYPWYQEEYRCGGSPPFFRSEELPSLIIRLIRWDSIDDECDGLYRISDSELVDYCARTGPGAFEECMSMSNEEYLSMRDSGIFRNAFPKAAWTVSMAAGSERALQYKLEALEKIVEETNGISIDPADMGHDAYEICIQNVIRHCWIFKAAFMPTGGFMCHPPMTYETIDQLWKYGLQPVVDLKAEAIEKLEIEDDYGDNVYGCLDEHGHFGHNESAYHSDHWEPKGEGLGVLVRGLKAASELKIQPFYTAIPTSLDGTLNYFSYARKIQHMLDPGRIADTAMMNSMWDMAGTLDEVEDLE